jgi:hypothetical protein
MSIRIKGTTNLQEVDANNNAFVNLPKVESQSGFATLLSEIDAGSITGSRTTKTLEVDADFRLITASDSHIFNEHFPGTAINTGIWNNPTTTMTTTVVNGFSVLNAGLSIVISTVAQLRTYRHVPVWKQATTRTEFEAVFTELPVAGNVCELGLFLASGITAPTDGAFFRINSLGEFRCVTNYNGVESQSAELSFVDLVGAGIATTFLIYTTSTTTVFWIDNIMVAEIPNGAGQGSSTSSLNLPINFRNYNLTATSIPQVLKIGNVSCMLSGSDLSRQWGIVISGNGGHSSQGQTGGTMGTTAIITNAAPTASAALSNTTAAAPNTGLGGTIRVTPSLAVGTPGILCSYQVPLGTSIIPGKSLYISGVNVDGVVTSALTGGPVIYQVSIAYGHTAVSLATTESAIAKAPRRVNIGMQSFVNTTVGTQSQRIQDDFTMSPICIQPGSFIQVTLQNLGYTATGTITFSVALTGFFE